MILDKQTLDDLSFTQGTPSLLSFLARCTTQAGTEQLRKWVLLPPATFVALQKRQEATQFWMQQLSYWPGMISNGTLVMIGKFFESADGYSGKEHALNLWLSGMLQKVFHKSTSSFVRFSLTHLVDFLKGCRQLVELLNALPPEEVRTDLEELARGLQHPLCEALLHISNETPYPKLMHYHYRVRREIRPLVYKMMECYARLDAGQALARATREHRWVLPRLQPSTALHYAARQLYHPLLKKPVAYDISFSREKNFLFLTGANMSGKSTLIRALGVSALLAHIGAGVPAADMEISFLEGIITNMQVEDNIILGESYFFAEVQRMKLTAQKLQQSRYYLVLMDELFKGTNVHDAYECSHAVIKGLLTQKDNLMALSTHLNELAEELKTEHAVWFRYCYTNISGNDYEFTYQLREGVSKDRIGFMVLEKEGVLNLLSSRNAPTKDHDQSQQ